MNEIIVSAEEETAGKILTIVPSNRSKKFHFFYSKGEVKRLPNDFVFPHMTLCTLVTSWFCGNPSTKTLPFKLLVGANIASKRMKNEHQKMKSMMGAVIAGAKQFYGCWSCRHCPMTRRNNETRQRNGRAGFELPAKTKYLRMNAFPLVLTPPVSLHITREP